MGVPPERIRNFCIVAHIDHGKSTLADRLMEFTGAITEREAREQYLDGMDLERERGITIKASTVRLAYKADDGLDYELNLIDTPGHVDFSYEVSRALRACEGAILVVDVTQGVEAQTVANAYQALDADLEIIPVLNKIDLPSADVEGTKAQIQEVIGLGVGDAVLASAKEGRGIKEVFEAVVKKCPQPRGDPGAPFRALVFDSWFDSYRGVIVLIRVVDGRVRVGDAIRLMSSGKRFEVTELGIHDPHQVKVDELGSGEVGYLAAVIKDIADAKIGDTITSDETPAAAPLPGFKVAKPMVFCGLFPTEPDQYGGLKEALEKLRLNDSSFSYEPETSKALGFGFRCGFLGLLHLEIIFERLEREYGLELITTAPTVVYEAHLIDGKTMLVDNPALMPDEGKLHDIAEPIIHATIHTPSAYIGNVMKICEEHRGFQKNLEYFTQNRAALHYELPLAEVVYDFFDLLKSVTKGYASLDYDLIGYRTGDLVKMTILVNDQPVDAFSTIVHRDAAYRRGRELTLKIRKLIPKQMYEVAIQASVGGRVLARETQKALRKDVLAKCYGGDVTRKRKLLEKQKEGKKRMKAIGKVEIPQEAFLAVLKLDKE
ncbi:MAG: elongation factor 4 [Deltaproteobacteria bacterium]|nr:elongation factor 4 [Deltaproteobacteria bacterium]